jgi:hypothetical protein
MSEAQNFWLLLLRYGYASAPHQQPKIPKESMTNLLNLTHTTNFRRGRQGSAAYGEPKKS